MKSTLSLSLAACALSCAAVFAHTGCSTDVAPLPDTPDASTDTDSAPSSCGNGAVELGEDCDDGNHVNGDGCQSDCTFTCAPGTINGDPKCDDKNPCTGTETCGADHKCAAGTPLAQGASCGTNKVCAGGSCADAVCGDGVVSAGEECDDGNAVESDGCDTSCKFSCVKADSTRNCTPEDVCKGQGTCNDATHVCAAGTPLADGTSCGSGKVCKTGTCILATCGDGLVESGEQCDFGAKNGIGAGCEVNCTFSCTKAPNESCITTDPCAGANTCTTVNVSGGVGQKCVRGAPLGDGTTCPNGGTCQGGVCKTPNCGNGTVDTGEDCDFGINNGPGSGCEANCKFSCTKSPNSCPNTDPCSPSTQTCVDVTVNGIHGQKCQNGTPLVQCAACGTGAVCISGSCHSSVCGDTCVDPNKGETCEPPNTVSCDNTCHQIVCGDGAREGTEQCDDGNTTSLDGCDQNCRFEQEHRANALAIQFTTDSFCPVNATGGAIGSVAQDTMQTSFAGTVKDGTTTIVLKFLNLSDMTGTNQANVQIGSFGGAPAAAPAGLTYNGNSDLDWWYTASAANLNPDRSPKSLMTGSIASKVLTATGAMDITLALGSPTPSAIHVSSAKIRANVGATSKPTVSASGQTPGHLAAEHLDPALVSFATTSNGLVCGNLTAGSLASVPIPNALLSGAGQCSEGYAATNSLLDALVGGCHAFLGLVAVVPTQPDQIDPAAPAAGAGGPYTLSANAAHVISQCRDKNNTVVPLDACLNAAAYSAYLSFTSDRVIAK